MCRVRTCDMFSYLSGHSIGLFLSTRPHETVLFSEQWLDLWCDEGPPCLTPEERKTGVEYLDPQLTEVEDWEYQLMRILINLLGQFLFIRFSNWYKYISGAPSINDNGDPNPIAWKNAFRDTNIWRHYNLVLTLTILRIELNWELMLKCPKQCSN